MFARNERRAQFGLVVDRGRPPEDLFATDDQVRERYRQPVRSRGVEDSIAALLQSWQDGDQSRARDAADEMERLTRSHFAAQGVPVFAHPILPPQFVDSVHTLIGDLSRRDQVAAIGDLVSHFRADLRSGVAQEIQSFSSATPEQRARVESEFALGLPSTTERFQSLGDGRGVGVLPSLNLENDAHEPHSRAFERQPPWLLDRGDMVERTASARPTDAICQANLDAWKRVTAEYKALLDKGPELRARRAAAHKKRMEFQRAWESDKYSPRDRERFHAEANRWLQEEQDLDAEERRWRQGLVKRLNELDQEKVAIRRRHEGCPTKLPDDPYGLLS